ncbi:MAG: ABC transporter ATP-binding protein [Gammaproteobacteria bacterium]
MKDPLLRLAGLRVQFPVRRGWFRRPGMLRALDGIDLELAPGEAVGVVGESGSGKSTLARAVLQLVRPSAGQVVWLGRALEQLTIGELRPLRSDLQIVFQDPLASLDPRMTVGEIVVEPLRVHRADLDRAGRRAEAGAMLTRVGLAPDMMNRYPHELSGGQCQRVGIARAMILRPKLLICDEPVSALDVSIQAQIVNLLRELKRDSGASMLFISHNLAVVRRLCERVLVLYLGRMMELAPTAALYSRPLHPYTRALLAAVPVPDPDVQRQRLTLALEGELPSPTEPPSGCVFRTRCPHAIERCRLEVPAWEAPAPERRVACHRWREIA